MSSSRRSFDSRPLTHSAESRREQCRALRADMRRSTVWRQCLATLSPLCLLQGHTRPVGRTEAWLVQHFLVPGHSASSPAARAADACRWVCCPVLHVCACAARHLDHHLLRLRHQLQEVQRRRIGSALSGVWANIRAEDTLISGYMMQGRKTIGK